MDNKPTNQIAMIVINTSNGRLLFWGTGQWLFTSKVPTAFTSKSVCGQVGCAKEGWRRKRGSGLGWSEGAIPKPRKSEFHVDHWEKG
jgi:hypothetical protein